MTRVSKNIRKRLREAIAHARGGRAAKSARLSPRERVTPLQKSIREAHADIAAYLAGDPSRVEISTVTVAGKTPPRRRKSRAGSN